MFRSPIPARRTPAALRPIPLVLAILAGAACMGPQPLARRLDTESGSRSAPSAARAESEPWAREPVLYARDGTVVEARGAPPADAQQPVQQPARGAENPAALGARDLQQRDSTRSTILEWYQNALEERDALQLEVSALHGELAKTREALRRSDAEIAALEGRVAALEAEGQKQLQLNLELAGRLTTAQIRRLQAEKLLLEAKIQQSRANQAAQARAAEETAELAPATGGTGRTGGTGAGGAGSEQP